jgi:hypothetical protein
MPDLHEGLPPSQADHYRYGPKRYHHPELWIYGILGFAGLETRQEHDCPQRALCRFYLVGCWTPEGDGGEEVK